MQQPPPQRRPDQVGECHQSQQDQDQGGGLPVFEEVECRNDLQPQAARPDHADSGRGPQIVLPAIDGGVSYPRQDLGPDGEAQDAQTGAVLAAQRALPRAGSMCSWISAQNLPRIPVEWQTRASTPGSGPKPTAATKMIPQSRVGIDRRALSQSRTGKRLRPEWPKLRCVPFKKQQTARVSEAAKSY